MSQPTPIAPEPTTPDDPPFIPADACQDVECKPVHQWVTGDVIDYDDGQTRLQATLVAQSKRQPGIWSCDLPGVELDERWFRRVD